MKKSQFLLNLFIGIGNLIVITTGILKKNKHVQLNANFLSQSTFLPGILLPKNRL